MRSLAVRIGIIGIIAVGAFVLRPFLSGNAGSLSVGDCFDEPAGSSGTIEDVQHHPCSDAHSAEVVFVGNYEPATATYPTEEAFRTFFEASCTAAFNAYTGLDFTTDPTYDMAAFTPTSDGWGGGDRKVICYAVRLDAGTMSSSIKKT